MRFIDEAKDEPFFCYIATNAPHGPLNVEPRHMTPYLESTAPRRPRTLLRYDLQHRRKFWPPRKTTRIAWHSQRYNCRFYDRQRNGNRRRADASQFPRRRSGSYIVGMRGKRDRPTKADTEHCFAALCAKGSFEHAI